MFRIDKADNRKKLDGHRGQFFDTLGTLNNNWPGVTWNSFLEMTRQSSVIQKLLDLLVICHTRAFASTIFGLFNHIQEWQVSLLHFYVHRKGKYWERVCMFVIIILWGVTCKFIHMHFRDAERRTLLWRQSQRTNISENPILVSIGGCLFVWLYWITKRVYSPYTSYFAYVYANDDSVPLVHILLTLILCFVCLSNTLLYIG